MIDVAYKTVQLSDGSLPLLIPMNEIAGRISLQVGAYFLQKENGDRGLYWEESPGLYLARW